MHTETLTKFTEQFHKIAAIGEELSNIAAGMSGYNNEPKMHGVSIYVRAWSNFTGFRLLWEAEHYLECEIVLRSAVEASICMANLVKRPTEFIEELRQDAAITLKGQTDNMRANGFETDVVTKFEQSTKEMFGDLKGKHLNWKVLAEQAKAKKLYQFHKSLSGMAAHVTGISLLRNVERADGSDTFDYMNEGMRARLMGMMCGTMSATILSFAQLAGDTEFLRRAVDVLGFNAPINNAAVMDAVV